MMDKAMLEARIHEEESDRKAYMELAEQEPRYARILEDIAHDERTHADMLRHILERETETK